MMMVNKRRGFAAGRVINRKVYVRTADGEYVEMAAVLINRTCAIISDKRR